MKYVIEITNKTFVLSVDKNLALAFGSFSDCPNSGSMILGAQLVHINEGVGTVNDLINAHSQINASYLINAPLTLLS